MTSTLRTGQRLGLTAVLVFLMVAVLLMLGDTAGAVQIQGGTTRVHTVEQGRMMDGIITLRNEMGSPEWVRLYLTDYLHDDRTGWQHPAANSLPRSCAAWVDLMQTELLLQPGEVRNVFYRVAVPDDAETAGTYWCALMVEPRAAKEVPVDAKDSDEQKIVLSIQHVIRYQVSLIINVGTSGNRSLSFLEPSLVTTEAGSTAFEILVENTGERWLNPEVWLEVYDDSGQLVGRVTAQRSSILPGVARKRVFDLTGLDAGEYQALLIVDDGEDAVFGTVFSLHLTSD